LSARSSKAAPGRQTRKTTKTCPICGKPLGGKSPGGESLSGKPLSGKPQEHAYRPFCSKRCADIDLARWLDGRYAIAGARADKSGSEDEDEGEVGPG
jgi:endogenous inhibitor of DNA gyrase (YacG/DUF329 family)